MNRRFALLGLTVSTFLVAAAYALAFVSGGGGTAAAMMMIFGIATMAISVMMLGASKGDRPLGIVGVAFGAVFIILTGGFALALLMPDAASALFFLGLPVRAAIVIYGIGILPVLILPLVYAATFEERTLSEEDLQKVREAAAERRTAGEASE